MVGIKNKETGDVSPLRTSGLSALEIGDTLVHEDGDNERVVSIDLAGKRIKAEHERGLIHVYEIENSDNGRVGLRYLNSEYIDETK